MKKRTYSGLTLINLLAAIAISAILAVAGIPSFATLLAHNQTENTYQRLFTLIQFARIQSINYQSQVLICPTTNQQDCINQWGAELMVFVDTNNDEERNDDEILLRMANGMNSGETLHWRASGSLRYLRYKPDGSTRNQNGRLTYCLRKGETVYAAQIIMYLSGRARRGSEEEALEVCG